VEQFDILATHNWQPFAAWGLTGTWWSLNVHTILNTWVTLVLLLIITLPTAIILQRKRSLVRQGIISLATFFTDLLEQTVGFFHTGHFAFIVSLFLFIIVANWLALIPFLEEPTTDLNTTVALALAAFFYVQAYGIKEHGFLGYLKEYATPTIVMAPLHFVGKIASIISLSFRLFGNIFGGAMVSKIYYSIIEQSARISMNKLDYRLQIHTEARYQNS
jgi:F-type H+-transporting ATPase subunit a